jgi:hypothetical protein
MAIAVDVLALAVVVIMGIQGVWLSFLTYRMWRHAQEREAERETAAVTRSAEANTMVEDLFLLHRSGLLVRHFTRRLRRIVDSDLLTGMLAAVSDFVKDSLSSEPGSLKEIRFGEIRIQVAVGEWAILAMVVRGERPADLVPRLQSLLAKLEGLRPNFLATWDEDQRLPPEAERLIESFTSDPLAFPAAPLRKSVAPLSH